MRRARRCGADLVPRIFQFYADFLQRLECFAQRTHTVEVKRQVVDRLRMWCAFEEPDDNRVVRQRDGLTGPEHFLQIEVRGPKPRALLRVSDGKAEMPDRAKLYFHVRTSSYRHQVALVRADDAIVTHAQAVRKREKTARNG